MRRHRHGVPPVRESTPNLAPMVDVVMVILIFFMLGANFAVSEGVLQTQLPSDVGPGGGATVSIVPVVRVALEVADAGAGVRITVLGQPLADQSFAALYTYMYGRREAGADPEGRVVVAPAPAVRYKYMISAFNACVRAGFRNVQFAIRTGSD